VRLREDTIRRPVDEAPCDHCGKPLRVGRRVLVDDEHGTVYCSRPCAQQDWERHGYGRPARPPQRAIRGPALAPAAGRGMLGDAMRKRRAIWAAVAVAVLSAALLLLDLTSAPWTSTDQAGYHRIKAGMSLAEVEAVLGRPPGDYSGGAYRCPEEECGVLDDGTRRKLWKFDDGAIVVFFRPDDGTVVMKARRRPP